MFRFVFLPRCARHTGRSRRKKILNAIVLTGALALSGCSASREELFECGPAEQLETRDGGESADESESAPAEAVTEAAGLLEETPHEAPESGQDEPEPRQDEPMYIDVRGAVVCPGVYPLPPGSRIWQALEAAGGPAEDAAVSYLNQAAVLEDGQQIYVPALQEIRSGEALPSASGGMVSDRSGWYVPGGLQPAAGADPGAAAGDSGPAPADGGAGETPEGSVPDGKVDLNTADVSLLMTLNGIGQVRAEAIVQYRDQAGGFGSIEEIMKVPGIKQGTFEKIRDGICVSGR